MPTLSTNRKAQFDYDILETMEAGLLLLGHEVKSIKNGQAKLPGGHVLVRGGEAYLVGMHIPPYQAGNTPESYDPDRTRKLLFTKKELSYLAGKTHEKGLTLVPLSVYTKRGLLKLAVGVARGKKKHDKRDSIQARESKRKIERTLKGSVLDSTGA